MRAILYVPLGNIRELPRSSLWRRAFSPVCFFLRKKHEFQSSPLQRFHTLSLYFPPIFPQLYQNHWASSDVGYTVSDPSVLSINEKGALTPLKAGVVTVKATSLHNSELYVEQTIEVLAPASSVEVSGLNKDIYYIGDVINLNSKVLPNNVSQNVSQE